MQRNDLIWIGVFAAAMLSGMLYSYVVFDPMFAIYAPFSILPPILFERGLILRSFRSWTNTLSTLAYIATKAASFSVLFLIGSTLSGLKKPPYGPLATQNAEYQQSRPRQPRQSGGSALGPNRPRNFLTLPIRTWVWRQL